MGNENYAGKGNKGFEKAIYLYVSILGPTEELHVWRKRSNCEQTG